MLEVTAAILIVADKVLIAQRGPGGPQAGMWEFPGGKLRTGESPEAGLRREIREELGVEVRVGGFFAESVHRDGGRTIRLLAYRVQLVCGDPCPAEHAQIAWAGAGELSGYTFSPADRPFVTLLEKELCTARAE
jgi:8-oxo-dGTP diphosphatase